MKLYCIFIVFLFTILFQPNIFGQNQYPVAFNGTIAADFYSSDQSNFGKFHGYVAELDISPLYYFHKTDNALTGYRYAIGMRTGITRWVGIYDDVDDLRWYLNVLPLARVYLNQESFFELSVGAKMQMYKRIWKELLPSFRQLTFKDTFDFLSRPIGRERKIMQPEHILVPVCYTLRIDVVCGYCKIPYTT